MKNDTLVENSFIFECHNCNLILMVNQSEINCGVFIHAIMNDSYQIVDPHSSEAEIEIIKDKIIGCGKQIKFEKNGNTEGYFVMKCVQLKED